MVMAMHSFLRKPVAINAPYHGEWSGSAFKRVDGQNFNDQQLASNVYTSCWQQKLIKGPNAPYAPARTPEQQASDINKDYSIIDYDFLNFDDGMASTSINKLALGTHSWLFFDANDVVWHLQAVFTPSSVNENILVEIYNRGEHGRVGRNYPVINKLIGSYEFVPQFHTPANVTADTWNVSFVNGLAENFTIEPSPDGSEVHLHILCDEQNIFNNTPFFFTDKNGNLKKSWLAGIIPITISGGGILSEDATHGDGLSLVVGTVRHVLHSGLEPNTLTENDISSDSSYTQDDRVDNNPECPETWYFIGDFHFYDIWQSGLDNQENTTYNFVMRSIWNATANSFTDIIYSVTRNDRTRSDNYYNRHWKKYYYCTDPPIQTEVSYNEERYLQWKVDQTHKIEIGTTSKIVDLDYNYQLTRTKTDYYGSFTDVESFSGAIDGIPISGATPLDGYYRAIDYKIIPFISFGGIAGLSVTDTESPVNGFCYVISPNEDNERIPASGWSTSQVNFTLTFDGWRSFKERKFDPVDGSLLGNGVQKF